MLHQPYTKTLQEHARRPRTPTRARGAKPPCWLRVCERRSRCRGTRSQPGSRRCRPLSGRCRTPGPRCWRRLRWCPPVSALLSMLFGVKKMVKREREWFWFVSETLRGRYGCGSAGAKEWHRDEMGAEFRWGWGWRVRVAALLDEKRERCLKTLNNNTLGVEVEGKGNCQPSKGPP